MNRLPAWLALLLVAAPAAAQPSAAKGQPGRRPAFLQPARPVAPPAPQASLLKREAWQEAPTTPVRPGEIDALVAAELAKAGIQPAPRTTDEQYLRRVTLDLTGQLPVPADVAEFLADSDPDKRARLIDRLLASDEYARHWAAYWRDVIGSKVTDRRGLALARPFEEWLTRQL